MWVFVCWFDQCGSRCGFFSCSLWDQITPGETSFILIPSMLLHKQTTQLSHANIENERGKVKRKTCERLDWSEKQMNRTNYYILAFGLNTSHQCHKKIICTSCMRCWWWHYIYTDNDNDNGDGAANAEDRERERERIAANRVRMARLPFTNTVHWLANNAPLWIHRV